jgi:hypothetical protein
MEFNVPMPIMDKWARTSLWESNADIQQSMAKKLYAATNATVSAPDPEHPSQLLDMLKSRMRWGPKLPFKVTSCHRLSHDKAVVFVIHEDRHLTIEDDWALFPSDTLVTQLRLIQGTK